MGPGFFGKLVIVVSGLTMETKELLFLFVQLSCLELTHGLCVRLSCPSLTVPSLLRLTLTSFLTPSLPLPLPPPQPSHLRPLRRPSLRASSRQLQLAAQRWEAQQQWPSS